MAIGSLIGVGGLGGGDLSLMGDPIPLEDAGLGDSAAAAGSRSLQERQGPSTPRLSLRRPLRRRLALLSIDLVLPVVALDLLSATLVQIRPLEAPREVLDIDELAHDEHLRVGLAFLTVVEGLATANSNLPPVLVGRSWSICGCGGLRDREAL